MNYCFVCRNKTSQNKTICEGCKSLLSRFQFQCKVCATELQTDNNLCGHCQTVSPNFSEVLYACKYESLASDWVLSLKFGQNIAVTKLMAELLLPELNKIDKEYVLLPVPLHQSRLIKRGYNQAYEIALELSRLSNRKLFNSLRRSKKTQMQAQLKLNQRNANVKGAFSVTTELKQSKIILVDDVMTSGYTINECAKTLKIAGASDVKVLVFARKSL